MKRLWPILRAVPAWLGAALPLLPLGLTRHRWWIAALVAVAALASYLRRDKAKRAYDAFVALYLVSILTLLILTFEIIDSASTDIWVRAPLTAAFLVAVFELWSRLPARWPKLRDFQQTGAGKTCSGMVLILAAILVFHMGQKGLWDNPGILPGVIVASTVLHFKPRWPVKILYLAFATVVVFEWHGYMNTKNRKLVAQDLPDGIRIDMVFHGDPTALQGARFFAPGRCDDTRGAYYMGEMLRTYRLNPDGSELLLVEPDEHNNNEAACSVIELCEEGVVISGSDEARFVRFSDIHTGRVLKDVPTGGQATFMVLSPDRAHLYVSTINPALIVRIDLATRAIDAELRRFAETDPAFSGVSNIFFVGDRLYGSYSSYFTIDNREGRVFSVDARLEDFRTLFSFHGSWSFIAPDDDGHIYVKVYSKPSLYRVAVDGSGARVVADLPSGYYYIAHVDSPAVVVANHWSTGEYEVRCENDFNRIFHFESGGMGRGMIVDGNRVMAAFPAGYATITLDEGLCD